MNQSSYAKAYTEVLEIISHFPKDEYDRIPQEKIQLFKDNMDKDYVFKIDPTIDLAEQNVSRKAKAILVVLFRDYFATESQKEKLKIILRQNTEREEKAKRERYNPDNLFKKKKATSDEDDEDNG